MSELGEQRKSILRRDLNDLVRDDSGHLSPSKIGTLAGQWMAFKYLLVHPIDILPHWDTMTVLFTVLIAPELFKKLMNMKYGGTTTTSESTTSSTKTTGVT